jgi:hypothetical protein
MERPPDLFVISALLLLVFALSARSTSPSVLGISTHWRGSLYVFPPEFNLHRSGNHAVLLCLNLLLPTSRFHWSVAVPSNPTC